MSPNRSRTALPSSSIDHEETLDVEGNTSDLREETSALVLRIINNNLDRSSGSQEPPPSDDSNSDDDDDIVIARKTYALTTDVITSIDTFIAHGRTNEEKLRQCHSLLLDLKSNAEQLLSAFLYLVRRVDKDNLWRGGVFSSFEDWQKQLGIEEEVSLLVRRQKSLSSVKRQCLLAITKQWHSTPTQMFSDAKNIPLVPSEDWYKELRQTAKSPNIKSLELEDVVKKIEDVRNERVRQNV